MLRHVRLFALGVLLMLAGASAAVAESMYLSVTVTYRERIALSPDAVVEVELLDTSRADAPAIRMSSQRFSLTGVPHTFQIGYDPVLIDERHTYTVAAKIMVGDETLFRSTTSTPALTRGAPDAVELTLEKMPAPTGQTGVSGAITGVTWAAYEIGGRALTVDNPPTLQLDESGRFGLFAGCNRFSGAAEIGSGTIRFPENYAGTLMACPEPREKLEDDVLEALSRTVGFVRDGALLSLTGDAGAVTMRFQLQQ